MILVWLLAWVIENTPNVQFWPFDPTMNTWGWLLLIAILLA